MAKKPLARIIAPVLLMGLGWTGPQTAWCEQAPKERTVSFAKGQWDSSQWEPLRMPSQHQAPTFTQRKDSLGTHSFTKEERKNHLDNVLLMTDSGTTEGEIEVEFHIGPEKGTAPGFFLAPVTKDGVLQAAIAVFVADYTMAAWKAHVDPATGKIKYDHLFRLARWQDPSVHHVFRCRYSKGRKSLALQVDESDVVVLRLLDFEINSKVGIWGCHGTCDYYRITVRRGGTLEWSGKPPAKE